MTQEQTEPLLNLTDLATEMGLTLDAIEETTPTDTHETSEEAPDNEAATEEITESESEADLSQENDSTEEESSAEDDDTTEDEKTEEEKPADHTAEKLLKRIDKITAKRREAEERAETLESEISELRAKLDASTPVQIVPTPSDPLADVETPEQLAERIAIAKKVRKWAIENLEGGTVTNAQGEEVYHEPAQVRQYLANADEVLTEHAPKREKWISERQAVLTEAKTAYPSLFKAGTQEHQLYQATLRAYPALKGLPNLEMIVGDAIEGQKLRFARQQMAAKKSSAPSESKTPAKASPPPSPAKGSKVPAKDIETRDRAKALFSRASALKSDDIAAFLEGAL